MTLQELQAKVRELFEQEKFNEITELLTDEILEQHKDAELYAMLARSIYKLEGDDDKILSLAEKAVAADQNSYLAHFVKGIAQISKAEYDKAIEDYDKSIELNSEFADAYYNRGVVWGLKYEYEKAIADYNKSIELKPNDAQAYNNRGNAWYSKAKYEKAIADYNKSIELKPQEALVYNNRGNAWYRIAEYDNAIEDYNTAIALNPDYVDAYYNRAAAWYFNSQDDKAVEDYDKAIQLRPSFANAYLNRGNVWHSNEEYNKAMADYDKAIELTPDYADAYYNRGLAIRNSKTDLHQSVKDFERYLELTKQKDDVWAKRAKDIIEELREKIKDGELKEIIDTISKIKKLLLISEGCVTHYTGLTVTKKLIWDSDTNFRISEGAFLNDTSEGTEFFKFLEYKSYTIQEDGLLAVPFAPKPFIGSFVAENKHDDLNLWRFYGKENGVEAKGCALTLRIKEFIDEIKQSLTKGSTNSDKSNDDDINFYRVAYWDHNTSGTTFQIPNTTKKTEKLLNALMEKIKQKVKSYRNEDRSILEKHLNSIAFLFKSDAYKNENEIRLVIKGIEFEKKFDVETGSPRVYIELINIRPLIEQITLGPKVDKSDEWAAVFHYSYEKETDQSKKPKRILISRLPYK